MHPSERMLVHASRHHWGLLEENTPEHQVLDRAGSNLSVLQPSTSSLLLYNWIGFSHMSLIQGVIKTITSNVERWPVGILDAANPAHLVNQR